MNAPNRNPRRLAGRGKAQSTLSLVDAMRGILEEIQPATVRAVCYRLFVAGVIADMSKNCTSKVSRHLVNAREEGTIPWAWVVDENRQAERAATWNNPDEIIQQAARQYRRNYWRDQAHWVEVWSEKGTVRGTLAPVLSRYGITLRVMHGYSSATALHDVAMETQGGAQPLTILYVGDFDPSGLAMSAVDIPERLARYGATADIRRVALTQADVITHDLPSFAAETKSKDTRHRWYVERHGLQCWELDAMPPPVLRENVENAILEFIDAGAWAHSAAIEAAETESMAEFLTAWGGISRPVPKYASRPEV